MPDKKALVGAAHGYIRRHPEEVLRALKNAAALRFGVPLDALRYLAAQAKGRKAPKDVQLEAVPPGIRAAATIDLMGTSVRASAVIFIEHVDLSDEAMRIEVRLADVSLKVLDEKAESPVAALIKSGALDLSKPGNLAAYMPKRPPVLVEAEDDRVVLDLMKHPKLNANGKAKRIVGMVTSLVAIDAIETDEEHLDVALRAFPRGLNEAIARAREVL